MSKHILFAIAAIGLLVAGIFMKTSNAHSARLQADQIIQADSTGTDTTTSLASLKAFVRGHMGASVSFTLQAAYDRAQAAAQAAAAASNASAQVYADAQRACGGKSDSITQARCNQQYLSSHLPNVPAPAAVAAPALSSYQYQLKAPLWTPDAAGALFLGALLSFGFAVPLKRKKGKW